MDINRSSLIQKFMVKGVVLTPFEAIHLKYLLRRGILGELVDAEKEKNRYITSDITGKSASQYMASFIISKSAKASPSLFRSYNFAYNEMMDQDSNSEKRGYRGLTLLTQLNFTQSEFGSCFDKDNPTNLLNYKSYSYAYQGEISYSQSLVMLAQIFKYFIQDMDIILTLNYYLNQLIKLEDLVCLDLFKMWLNNGESLHNDTYVLYKSSSTDDLIDENHNKYIERLSWKLEDMSPDFSKRSLAYVKKTLKIIVESVDKQTPQLSIS